jgi:hypothetical protein
MTRLREISDVTDDEAAVNIDALCAHVPGMRVPRLVNALSPDCAYQGEDGVSESSTGETDSSSL